MANINVVCENGITAKMRQVRQPSPPIKTAERITLAAYERATKPLPAADTFKNIDASKLKAKD